MPENIPDTILNDAAQAAYERDRAELDGFGAWIIPDWDEADGQTRRRYRAIAEAAIQAAAAEIWEQGAQYAWFNTGEGWNGEYADYHGTHDGRVTFREANPDAQNPYRASETA